MIEEVRHDTRALERVHLIGTPGWDELVAGADEVSSEQLATVQQSLDPHDPINIQYTSGTTGFPKGATSPAPPTAPAWSSRPRPRPRASTPSRP